MNFSTEHRAYYALLILMLFASLVNSARFEPVVKTQQGYVKGFISFTDNGRAVNSFMGIPYGTAKRFQYAEMRDPWVGVLPADVRGPMCPQSLLITDPVGEEDCLLLDVYTPRLPIGNISQEYPVLVFVHGGLYKLGASGFFGPKKFLDKNIVLVVIQYRLGALGFLATTDGSSPGNYGLADQLLSLQWVQQNIRAFNGDPNRVTVMGQSAGASSLHLLYLTPLSKGLFHRCILLSGSALVPFAIRSHPDKDAKILAEFVGCPDSRSGESIVRCLREASAEEITQAVIDAEKKYKGIFFGPVVQTSGAVRVLEEHPEKLIKAGKFEKRPVILGFTKNDGLFLVSSLQNMLKEDGVVDDPDFLMNHSIRRILDVLEIKDVDRSIENRLLGELRDVKSKKISFGHLAHKFMDLLTLIVFSEPAYRSAQILSIHGVPVYTYVYKYLSKPHFPSFTFLSNYTHYVGNGVDHVEDLSCYFDLKLKLIFNLEIRLVKNVGAEDKRFCSQIIDLWYEYISSGTFSSGVWPKFEDKGKYLIMDEKISTGEDYPSGEIWTTENVFKPISAVGLLMKTLQNPSLLLPPLL